jgi:hypothetical protein
LQVPTSDSETAKFITLARQHIVSARIRLAEQHVTPSEARELWRLVDWIESIIKMRVRSFEFELEHIDRELERRLRRQ